MATPLSPQRTFNGLTDEDQPKNSYGSGILDANYSHEISGKMRVPKRIRATGEYSDEDLLLSNQNGMMNSWNYNDKIDMYVPDRIMVMGHNQHLGTRSAPREIDLENSVLPKDPDFIRVATPPRIIKLSDHIFPSASDEQKDTLINNNGFIADGRGDGFNNDNSTVEYIKAMNGNNIPIGFMPNDNSSVESDTDPRRFNNNKNDMKKSINFDQSLVQREGTPVGELSPPEEILYLRRQLAKLNRRVLSIEIDNVQRQQREKIIYCLGLAYFLLKTIFWLNKN